MPIYEYECKACGHQCEFIQKFSDPLKTDCPHCEANQLVKLVSAPSFQLKGTGWYVTDFRDQKKPATKKEDDSKPAENTDNKDTSKPAKNDDVKKEVVKDNKSE